jgi:hypothetical protein
MWPWWWRRYVPLKRRFLQESHGVSSPTTAFFFCCFHYKSYKNEEEMNCSSLPKHTNKVFVNIHSSMVLQLFFGPHNFLGYRNPIRNSLHGLDGRSARLTPAACTQDNKNRVNAHRQQCLGRNSNPGPQCLSGRRCFMSQKALSVLPACFPFIPTSNSISRL